MASLPISKVATTTSDAAGNAVFNIPQVPAGRTWEGTVIVQRANGGASHVLTVNGNFWGQYSGGQAGQVQAFAGSQIMVTSTGLTPTTPFTASFTGAQYDTARDPIAPFPAAPGSGAFTQVARVVADGTSNIFTVASLPQGAHTLLVQGLLQTQANSLYDTFTIQYNGDSGAHYSYVTFSQYTGGSVHTGATGFVAAVMAVNTSGGGPAARFSPLNMTVYEYAGPEWKQALIESWEPAGAVNTLEGEWQSATAVTSLTLTTGSAANWTAGSAINVYALT